MSGSIGLAILLLLGDAHATWSIVAVDTETEEVGIAGATCGPFVWGIGQVVPGQGAVAAQYDTWIKARKQVAEALEAGDSAEDALATVLDSDYDSDLAWRQYGVVAFDSAAVAWTGDDVEQPYATASGDTFSVQGNTLASEAVVQAAFDLFSEADLASGDDRLPLEERLLQALEAGAAEGGDNRCDPEQAAKSAFLYVAAASDDPDQPRVKVRSSSFLNGDPAVERLRREFEGEVGCHALPRAGGWLAALAGLLALGIRRRRRL